MLSSKQGKREITLTSGCIRTRGGERQVGARASRKRLWAIQVRQRWLRGGNCM